MNYITLTISLALMAIVYVLLRSFDLMAPGTSSAMAPLVGALAGSAAVLLGNSITALHVERKAHKELKKRVSRVKALVTAELVNVALGLIDAKQRVDASLRTINARNHEPEHDDLTRFIPKPMHFTNDLGIELLVLEEPDIDVLVILRANLARTGMRMEEVTAGKRPLDLLTLSGLYESIQHDMGILSEAFQRFGPERKFTLPGKSPELYSSVLSRLSAEASV